MLKYKQFIAFPLALLTPTREHKLIGKSQERDNLGKGSW